MTNVEIRAPMVRRLGKTRQTLIDENLPIKRPREHPSLYALRAPRSTIGRYEIIYPIAAGGMASVYTGRLSGMAGFERLFAIKVIHPHLAAHRSFIEMFLDEARLAGQIHHPNVAEIFEVGEEDGLYYMVGELVLGQDLKQLVDTARRKGTSIPHPIIADIISNVARGLHEAHELCDEDGEPSQLVHRDISTQNILISYKGYAKLIDFGVAWARGRLSHTRDGSQKGKIGYMPPEQLRGEQIDRRSDIYALGVVLYTMLVGVHPFPYDNEGEQVAKMLAGNFPRPRTVNPSISRELEMIILKAMAKRPDHRYATAADMGKALSSYVEANIRGDATKQVADLMHSLFQEEIRQHEEKIRAHRRKTSVLKVTTQKRAAGKDPVTTPSRVTEVIVSDSDGSGEQVSSVRVPRALLRNRLIPKATIPAALLIGLVFLFVSSFQNRTTSIEKLSGGSTEALKTDVLISHVSDHQLASKILAPNEITIQVEGILRSSVAYLDGEKTALPIRTRLGHTPVHLRIETPGYEAFQTTLKPDRDRTVLISLKKNPPPKTANRAKKSTGPKKGNRKKSGRKKTHLNSTTPKMNLEEWERNPFL